MEFVDKRPDDKRHPKPCNFVEITADMLGGHAAGIDKLVEESVRKRDDACFAEIAAVYLRYFPDVECTGPILRNRINQLLEAERRLQQSDCPTCGKYPTCYHNHGRHGVVRINCPLWRPKA